MAEHCTQLGLPAREDYIFVAKALSQVRVKKCSTSFVANLPTPPLSPKTGQGFAPYLFIHCFCLVSSFEQNEYVCICTPCFKKLDSLRNICKKCIRTVDFSKFLMCNALRKKLAPLRKKLDPLLFATNCTKIFRST